MTCGGTSLLLPVPPEDPIARAAPVRKGVWTSHDELQSLPVSGPAWKSLMAAADKPIERPKLRDQNDTVDVHVLAKALVYSRTQEARYRDDVVSACREAIGTEAGGSCLGLGRNIAAYVIAADLVKLPDDQDVRFRAWLREQLVAIHEGQSLRSTHEDRPNNWGTHAGGSRAAIARYLGDALELERTARVFKGWLGDRAAYSGFRYRDLSWQADSAHPAGVNPKGATKEGHSIDGVLPDDQRRGGKFRWPPAKENYVYEAMQGALLQAVVLHRAGFAVWDWEDKALLRAFRWLHDEASFPAVGDDTWQPHVMNYFYGTAFPAPVPARPGKNVGWTDWTLGKPMDTGTQDPTKSDEARKDAAVKEAPRG